MKSIDLIVRAAAVWMAVLAFTLVAPTASAENPTPLSGKRVEIDKTHQILRAYEGEQLFLQTRISTGKGCKSTPNGHFSADDKQLMHYSRLYHHAPMPFSIQINGNIFIHGFTYVPAWPASHGCIRVPLDGDNPARRLYEWIDIGTPIEVFGQWARSP